jgi:hypothetical protein
MMNYEIRTDSEELRDRIVDWTTHNINAPWRVTVSTWCPDDDREGKWGLFIDGGTVSTRRKLLSAFKGESLSIQESGESWQTGQ